MKNQKEYWYKLEDGSVRMILTNLSPEKVLPEGAELVEAPLQRPDMSKFKEALVWNETYIATDLDKFKEKKLEEIRVLRDEQLLENDKQWLIASKKGEDTSDIEAEAQALRDMPETASLAMASMATIEEVEAYDPFTV